MSFRLKALLAGGALALSSGAALAQTAVATTDANVRSGPGAQYQVIDQLPAGETVHIVDCDGSWCEISMGRGDPGFVHRSLLDDGGSQRSRVVVTEPDESVVIEEDDPDAIVGLAIGGYWESRPFYIREGYYYWGGRWYPRRPGAPGWRDGSWRRWADRRGPGDPRGGHANRPRIDTPRYANRPPRDERRDEGGRGGMDRRERGVERGGEDRGGEDRMFGRGGGDHGGRGPERDRGGEDRMFGHGGGGDRGGRGPETTTMPRSGGSDGGGRTPDRGDRIGLDRAGGGRN